MALTRRQYDILKYFTDNVNEVITSNQLASRFNVSTRTIKKELALIREYSLGFESFVVESIVGKGTKLTMIKNEDFKNEIELFETDFLDSFSNKIENIDMNILKIIVNHSGFISKDAILDHFYISESRFYKSYQQLKDFLKDYSLEIEFNKDNGYQIVGSEVSKRSLIAKYELLKPHDQIQVYSNNVSEIYNFVAETFLKYEYKITDQILQNISSHIVLMVQRVGTQNTIDSMTLDSLDHHVEYSIALEICSNFLSKFYLSNETFKNEVSMLTQTILGKISYSIDEKLQKDVNDFIDFAFKQIEQKFSIDFELAEKLRLFLVLHIVPLIYRIRSSTQLRNAFADEIAQQFPQANDISLYFSILFDQHYDVNITKDEISYLTIYFNYGIEELDISSSSKKVLVLTILRQSETVLLKHRLLTWFPKQIEKIQFVDPSNVHSIEFEEFDAILTTEKDNKLFQNAVTEISVFPDQSEYTKINLAINGFTDAESILDKFSKNCFFRGSVKNKDEVLSIVCNNAKKEYKLNNDFTEAIKHRESIASTYFGNGVAIPHPLAPSTKDTFVSIAILDKPIEWDSEHSVQFIMLISIEEKNPKAFQFWYYLSDLVRDSRILEKIIKCHDYDTFIKIVRESLDSLL